MKRIARAVAQTFGVPHSSSPQLSLELARKYNRRYQFIHGEQQVQGGLNIFVIKISIELKLYNWPKNSLIRRFTWSTQICHPPKMEIAKKLNGCRLAMPIIVHLNERPNRLI